MQAYYQQGWDRKALRLGYQATISGRTVVVGAEVRGLFKATPTGIMAAEMQDLRDLLERYGHPQKEA